MYDILVKECNIQWDMTEINEIMKEDGFSYFYLVNGWDEFGIDVDFMVISEEELSAIDVRLFVNHYVHQDTELDKGED